MLLVAIVAGLLPTTGAFSDDSDTTPLVPPLHFVNSGLDGGGFQNALALRDGVLIAGGDVSGFNRSDDGGATWQAHNRGVEALGPRYLGVADVAFSHTQPDTVYGCTTKGLYRSTDSGLTWALLPASPVCFAGSAGYFSPDGPPIPELPFEHPRSTGNLVAEVGDRLVVGSFDRGIQLSSDDGATWSTLGLAPELHDDGTTNHFYIRSLVADPAQPAVAYVGTYDDGIWKLDALDTDTPTLTHLDAAPTSAEEITVVGGVVYVAAGADGLFRSPDAGATWEPVNNGVDVGGQTRWIALDGVVDDAGVTTLYAGSSLAPRTANGQARSVVKSTDGGASWQAVTLDPTTIHGTIGGPDGPNWWLFSSRPPIRFGREQFVAAQIVIDPAQPDVVYVAGRSGVWKTTDGGVNWYPMMRGLGVTISRALAVNPADPNGVMIGVTDWIGVRTADGGATITADEPPIRGAAGKGNMATAMASDATRVYLGVGNRDTNTAGSLWSRPFDGSAGWVDEGLSAPAGGKRPFVVTAFVDDTGARVLLAVVGDGDTWRKVGSGPWTSLGTNGPQLGPERERGSFAALDDGHIFFYDLGRGVMRSSDYGRTWSLVWPAPQDAGHTGFLMRDPYHADALYLSNQFGLFRLRDVSTDTITFDAITAVPRPGSLTTVPATDGSTATYVASLAGVGPFADAGLYVTTDGDTWTDVADDEYRRQALIPHQIAGGSDGRVYVSLDGNGLLVGLPPNPVPTTTTTTGPSTTTTSTSTTTTSTTTTTPPAVDRTIRIGATAYSPASFTTTGPNYSVAFLNPTAAKHGVVEAAKLGPNKTPLFDSGTIAANARWQYRFVLAGAFKYTDPLGKYAGTARIAFAVDRASAPSGTPFTLTLSSAALPAHVTFDVQVKKPGAAGFVAAATKLAAPTFAFTPNAGAGTYVVRARVHTVAGTYSGWSPVKSLTVT
ncbi:MAG: hypothetical protein QOK28_2666 [Actinomycetota bacterium]